MQRKCCSYQEGSFNQVDYTCDCSFKSVNAFPVKARETKQKSICIFYSMNCFFFLYFLECKPNIKWHRFKPNMHSLRRTRELFFSLVLSGEKGLLATVLESQLGGKILKSQRKPISPAKPIQWISSWTPCSYPVTPCSYPVTEGWGKRET